MRASINSVLRGVKIVSLMLAAIMFISLGSVITPQPVKAEGFLSKTTRCLVGALLWMDCRDPRSPVNPSTPEAPVVNTPNTQASPPAYTPNLPDGGQSSSNTNYETPAQNNAVGSETAALNEVLGAQAPLDPSQHRPIEIRYTSDSPLYGQVYPMPHSFNSTAQLNSYSGLGQPQVKGLAAAALVEPSNEGWRIAGIAWYWWALGIAIITGVIVAFRRRRLKKNSVLSKAE